MIAKVLKLIFYYRIWSGKFLFYLVLGIPKNGFGLRNWMWACSKYKPEKIAFADDEFTLSYGVFYQKTQKLQFFLIKKCSDLQNGIVVISLKNSINVPLLLTALDGIAKKIILVNSGCSRNLLEQIAKTYKTSHIITNEEIQLFNEAFQEGNLKNNLVKKNRIRTTFVIHSSGTTGAPSPAHRQLNPSLFILPFHALVSKIQLQKYTNVVVTPPLMHGFGLASLFTAIALQKKVFLTDTFDTRKIGVLIQSNSIEVVVAVPLLIDRFAQDKKTVDNVQTLISGGSILSNNLPQHILKKLYSLYGTTESGFCFIATPHDLLKYKNTIGKPIEGVRFKFSAQGELLLSTQWSIFEKRKDYLATGDLIQKSETDHYFFVKRLDNKIKSGAFLIDIEELKFMFSGNNQIEDFRLEVINDSERFQIYHAYIKLCKPFQAKDFEFWLEANVPKYMHPKKVEFIKYNIQL